MTLLILYEYDMIFNIIIFVIIYYNYIILLYYYFILLDYINNDKKHITYVTYIIQLANHKSYSLEKICPNHKTLRPQKLSKRKASHSLSVVEVALAALAAE